MSTELSQDSPLYGLWNVEELAIDGVDQPPLFNDEERWRRVIFDQFRPSLQMQMAIQPIGEPIRRFALAHDPESQSMKLTSTSDPEWEAHFRYELNSPDDLVIEGTYNGQNVRAQLHRETQTKYLLLDRGFRWINETPFLQ